ncbi:endonuclease/exonuclease/phosphatase family protein [Adhaeribacter swui]|uniref:Endonuclease/exonuclease/phosphatase family protein n=1 Tax=Adhaeribacter swui TaxID=2086471 RepID=A0A7G7G500_9BACT|nr:endonuclease/exonuclease/phosphatase family protein [Adhaeribacter swui]QNF32234.1 endonuclease/exonuclease/phosphatase family protein [Adhaeribacter swui]
MKLQRALYFLIVFCLLSGSASAQQLTVGSFNIRFDNPRDEGNLWADRAPAVAALLQFHDFDIFGTQEGLKNQLDDISKALPGYARYGKGRDDGQEKGEHSAIFFKKDRFKLLKSGDFWLSQTPDKPSLGWDATCCNRICSWVYLQDQQTKKKFYVFNVHYDHQGVQARQESSKLILSKIKEIARQEPVILTGDFNGDHNSEWYQAVANSGQLYDTYKAAKNPYALNASFNAFGKKLDGQEIIDHVFTTKDFKVQKWGVLTDTYHGKFPSDHFPILVKLSMGAK